MDAKEEHGMKEKPKKDEKKGKEAPKPTPNLDKWLKNKGKC